MAVHKKYKESKKEESASTSNAAQAKAADAKSDLADAKEPVVISDTVTETTEKIEVIEEVAPEPKSETEAPAESIPVKDPLSDFKEKMNKEELAVPDMPHKKNFMWPILFIVFLALALLAGVFIYKQAVKNQEEVNVVTLVTPTVIAEPSKAEIDLSKYEIEILNGSEIDGEAGRQKDNLEGEGFKVSSIDNAENSDYTKTIIQAKEDVDKDFLDKLKSVLEQSFVVDEIGELPEDAESDVIVIIGSLTN